MEENKKGTFLIFAVLLFLLNMELIGKVFSLRQEAFTFELLLLIFLGIMAVDSMNEFTKKNHSCFSVLAVYFGINLLNIAGLSVFTYLDIDVSMMIIAGLGFIISIVNIQKKEDEEIELSKDIEKAPPIDVEEAQEVMKSGGGAIITEYYPGKYLASKTGKKYHSPKCDFAKKIPKRNHVWFSDKAEARKKGYAPCKCI